VLKTLKKEREKLSASSVYAPFVWNGLATVLTATNVVIPAYIVLCTFVELVFKLVVAANPHDHFASYLHLNLEPALFGPVAPLFEASVEMCARMLQFFCFPSFLSLGDIPSSPPFLFLFVCLLLAAATS
jgi:hypothetical protein